MNSFFRRVMFASERNNSMLCVGLDPNPEMITGYMDSKEFLYDFLVPIIDATSDLVCAYKPNIAFFEAMGISGLKQLRKVIDYIRKLPMDIPIILDAKRNDIGNTARAYARAAFDDLEVDAITVNPYMGRDSLMPFIEREERGILVLCLTSNPGYADFEKGLIDGKPLFLHVAEKAAQWNMHENIGLVVGATHPEEAALVRDAAGDLPFLVPGIGAQGGDARMIMKVAVTNSGIIPIVNSSRGILFAGKGPDYAGFARKAAIKTRNKLNKSID